MAQYEIKRAKRWELQQREAIEARASQVQELHSLAQDKLQSAKTLHKEAVSRIKESNQETLNVTRKVREMKEKDLQDRIDAVLELKANQDAVHDKVATQAAKYQRKVAEAKARLDNEKEAMVAQGINPYEEFRSREFELEARRREKRMQRRVEDNKAALANKLLAEESVARRENIKIKKNKVRMT